MFDIGFSELLVVGIIALLVIGPERMPEAVHKVLSTWRGLRRSLHNARMDVEREMGMDDIRRRIHNEEIMRNLNASRDAIDAVKDDIHHASQDIHASLQGSVHAAQGNTANTTAPDNKPDA